MTSATDTEVVLRYACEVAAAANAAVEVVNNMSRRSCPSMSAIQAARLGKSARSVHDLARELAKQAGILTCIAQDVSENPGGSL